MQKTERLYVRSWEYNAARILTELAVIVENNGGKVVYADYDHNYLLSNRSIHAVIRENQARIDGLKGSLEVAPDDGKADKRRDNIERLIAENAEYAEKYHDEAENPIECTHKSYIKFTLDDHYYYYQVDDNPFFEFYADKYPIVNGKYDAHRYGIEDKKEWLLDCYLKAGCSKVEIREAANLIFNWLVSARCGKLVTEKKRVPNYYDHKYHYEQIHEPIWREVGKF